MHHSVGANGYRRSDSAAIVLAICRFHRDSRAGMTSATTFLVDRFGQIFEGRAGGVDQPVIGAHAEGYNAATTGIANLGTFSGVAAGRAAVDPTAQLLAWKLSLHGIPPLGRAVVRSAGGATNRHQAGAQVTLQNISGHRDADRTSCPGNRLQRQLPQIRKRAAELAAALPPRAASPASVTPETLRFATTVRLRRPALHRLRVVSCRLRPRATPRHVRRICWSATTRPRR